MAQRKRNSNQWFVTGKYAKVAAKDYMITNVTNQVLTLTHAIPQSSINHIFLQERIPELDSLALIAAHQLRRFYPNIRVIGFDIGIDGNGKLWIIEANFKPTFAPFRKLDTGMYEFHAF